VSLWARPQQRALKGLPDAGVQPRADVTGRRNAVAVNPDTALRHSAVWACLRIRADLISTFPVDTFRKVGDIDVEVPKPPVLVDPGGRHWPYMHWMWASQFALDRQGNTVGVIVERNALNLPSRIELYPASSVSIYQRPDMTEHRYRIDGKEYTPDQVWHERQFPVPGLPVGLSPVAYAAWTLSEALSMQQFALDWFGGGGMPKARLHNTKRSLESGPQTNEARRIKDRYMATVANGDVFVHGNDWELNFMQAEQAGVEWLDGRRFLLADCSRWFGVPVDLIEAAVSAPGTITYQSALQRNLQFLVMHLAPAIIRRETALSSLLPRPRFVKLNTNALLRMDAEQQAKVIDMRIKNRTLTITEARELYNLPPLTPQQEAEFARVLGGPRSGPNPAQAPEAEARAAWWEPVNPLSAAPYPSEVSP
jgi:HK97 family phage portal protein